MDWHFIWPSGRQQATAGWLGRWKEAWVEERSWSLAKWVAPAALAWRMKHWQAQDTEGVLNAWRWLEAEPLGQSLLMARGWQTVGPQQVGHIQGRGFMGKGEQELNDAIWPYMPVWPQVLVLEAASKLRYHADLVVLNPWDASLWVVEVDGTWHDKAEVQQKDRVKESLLRKAGIGVARISSEQVLASSPHELATALLRGLAGARLWPRRCLWLAKAR